MTRLLDSRPEPDDATRAGDGSLDAEAIENITDRKESEQEVQRLDGHMRKAQRLEAMGALASGIAHDFNNILGVILGYCEIALLDAPEGGHLRRDLNNIMIAGERGRALVDRILGFSRAGAGEPSAVHVEQVVREALNLIAARCPAGITVESQLRAGRAAVWGEPTQVHQVLMNLATNAIQAMETGGRLRVGVDVEDLQTSRAVVSGTIGEGEYVVVAVADSGCGIAKGYLDRIFDPFFSTKDVGVGTGLGLSVVLGIVNEVGGGIDVRTTLGQGSVFSVYLPRVGDADDDAAEIREAPLPRGKGECILVVDDEEALARLAEQSLRKLCYVPETFISSTAALAAFRANPYRYDVVVSDERMPGLSGSMLLHEVRSIRPDVPTLLVSGFIGADLVGRAKEIGADHLIRKPMSMRDLATGLAKVLARPAANTAPDGS